MGYDVKASSTSEAEHVGFEFSSVREGASFLEPMLSAEELFCDGKLRPLAKSHLVGSHDPAFCLSSPSLTSCSCLPQGHAEEKYGKWELSASRHFLVFADSVAIADLGWDQCACSSSTPTDRQGLRKEEKSATPFADAASLHLKGDGLLSQQRSPEDSEERVCLAALPASCTNLAAPLIAPSSPPFSVCQSSSSSIVLTSPSSPPFSPLPSLPSSLFSSCSLSPCSSSSSLSKDGSNSRELPHPSLSKHPQLYSEQSTYTSCSCRFPLRSLWPFSRGKETSFPCSKSSRWTSIQPKQMRRKRAIKVECKVSSTLPTLASPCKSSASKPSQARASRQSRHAHAVMMRSSSKNSHPTSKNASCQWSKGSPMLLGKDDQRRSCDHDRMSRPEKRNTSLNAHKSSPHTHTQRVRRVSGRSGGDMGMQMDLGAYASKKGANTPSIRVTPVISIAPGCMGPSFNKTKFPLPKTTSNRV